MTLRYLPVHPGGAGLESVPVLPRADTGSSITMKRRRSLFALIATG
jgi:hypothetical protein